MVFNVFIIGVGGEGAISMGVVIARAANMEGKYVRGVQLHGLAQRGGSIPAFVRFGSKKELSSPKVPAGHADLVLSFEPLEAMRALPFASKKRSNFIVSESRIIPVYANILKIPYPTIKKIKDKIKPFAKSAKFFEANEEAKKLAGRSIFGNTFLLGAACGAGWLPLKRKNIEAAIKSTLPATKENLKVFVAGFEAGKN